MSGIFDQIINYSPPLIVSGTVNYKGTWDASTNNPPLSNPPVASTKGDYYVVSTAGTQFSISFAVGDWIISSGTAWEKVDLTDAVSSVFGRTGAVVGVSTDYSAVGLTNTAIGAANPSTGAFTSLSSSSTTTLNGTTIPASKTLVVTTDKLSALAATTSAELAGVISDETGSGALVFANSPTLVTPALGTPSSGTVTNLTGTASININGTVGATTPSTGVFSALTVNDNSTLGSSNTDTVTFNARVASDINPSADDTYDLGVTGHEWRNLNIDGTANIDSLVADTADINGGTIDGTTVGATTPSTGRFTTVRLDNTDVLTWGGAYGAGIPSILGSTGAGELQFRPTGSTNGTVATLTSTGLNSTAIGATTPSTGAFTTLSATRGSAGAVATLLSGNAAQSPFISFGRASEDSRITIAAANDDGLSGTVAGDIAIGSNASIWLGTAGTGRVKVSSTGLAVTGALSSTTGANFATSSGNVGIGTASPSTVYRATINGDGSSIVGGLSLRNNGTETLTIGNITANNNVDIEIWNPRNGYLRFATNNAERMRIDSSGNLLVGKTDTSFSSNGFAFINGGAFETAGTTNRMSLKRTNDGNIVEFYQSVNVGTISITSSATSYNTSSDYRRKSNVKDLTGSGTFIDALKPRTFDWDTGDKGVGFIAHEFAEVSPSSVTGQKDAVDSDGKPVYQAMQASSAEVIANLVAELQSLRARVAALESK